MQRELDAFHKSVGNIHRIRVQKEVYLTCGVPQHVYQFSQEHDLENRGKT